MKILSTIYNIAAPYKVNNHNDCYQYSSTVLINPIKPLSCDTISFGRTAENAEPLRALMAYGIPDMYSGRDVIDPKILEEFYSKHVFSRSIKNIIRFMKPYEKCLHTVEHQFYSIVKNKAKIRPEYTLADVVREIGTEHNQKLLEVQQPIFDDLTELARELPLELHNEFDSLMAIIYKKINHHSVTLPFSAKEFQYKLQRIADECSQKNNSTENIYFKRILHLSKKLPENIKRKNKDGRLSKARRNKRTKNNQSLLRERAEILTQIELLAAGTSLKNNQELAKLFAQTRAKIYNMPVVIPFNRKSFIYDIQKITDKLDDTKLARKMLKKAIKLPTSHTNLSAFVMKCLEYSSDKIGYNMVSGSAGSIDHLIPFIKNGKDCIENYGISSAYYNSERADRSISQQLRLYPQTYKNCQKQVDRLIELCNKGYFQKVKLSKHYIYSFAKRMYELSPPEKKMILDLSKLK